MGYLVLHMGFDGHGGTCIPLQQVPYFNKLLQNHQVTITIHKQSVLCKLIPQLLKFQKKLIEIDKPHLLK
jgi:hypothetical protein